MASKWDGLGGRLPLLGDTELTPGQREYRDWILDKYGQAAIDAGYRVATPDGRLIGPFNGFIRRPEAASAFQQLVLAEQQHTRLSADLTQIVPLVQGAVWDLPYEPYVHVKLAIAAGIPEDAARALARGEIPGGLTDTQKVTAEIVRAITTDHRVDSDLYARGRDLLGEEGLVDLSILLGEYFTTAILLNLFEMATPPEE